jgi:hypothetical protein
VVSIISYIISNIWFTSIRLGSKHTLIRVPKQISDKRIQLQFYLFNIFTPKHHYSTICWPAHWQSRQTGCSNTGVFIGNSRINYCYIICLYKFIYALPLWQTDFWIRLRDIIYNNHSLYKLILLWWKHSIG